MRFLLLAGAALAVTPVEKVTQLLVKLQGETEAEGQAEAATYDKFACFCKETASDKLYAIEKETEAIEKLDADIELLKGEIEALDKKVADGNTEIDKLTKESKDAIDARSNTHKDFKKKYKDLNAAIAACKRALEAVKDGKGNFMQVKEALALAFVQRSLEETSRSRISVLQQQPDNTYTFHSSEIVQVLADLIKTFKGNAETTWNEEAESKQEHDMAEGARQNQIAFTQEDVDNNSALSAKKNSQKTDKSNERDERQEDKDQDQAFLDEVTTNCENKAKTFDQRSSTRVAELKALAEAIALLKGAGGENYSANKRLNLLSEDEEDAEDMASFFFQTGSQRRRSVNLKAFELIKNKAMKLKSTALAALAIHMKKDHFVKVRDMIKDLISKLEAQAEDEATAKAACDKDMKAAIGSRDDANIAIERETSAIAANKAEIANLNEQIKELEVLIAETTKELAEATELRKKEKAENEETIATAEEGVAAIENAIKVLKGFYENASFVQVSVSKSTQSPSSGDRDGVRADDAVSGAGGDTFSDEYNGNQETATGIFGLLDVIKTDYDNTILDTKTTEEKAESEFNTQKEEMETAISTANTEKDEAEGKKSDEMDAKATNEDDLESEEKNLENATKELGILKGRCVDDSISHEERLARRKQEIESLKEALEILREMDGSFLQRH
jgi:hypothetical protein